MRVTVPSPLLATQTASEPTTTAPGSGPTPIGSPIGSPLLEVEAGDRVVGRVGDPDGAGAGVDAAGAFADLDRVAEDRVQSTGRRG